MIMLKGCNFVIISLLLISLKSEAKKITLPQHLIDGRCVLTQSMFYDNADEYIIKNRYDLMGASITIPKGAVLVFKGSGSVYNGTLVGQESSVKVYAKKTIFHNIFISGYWKVGHIYSDWFDFGSCAAANTRNLRNLCTLSDDKSSGVIHIAGGDYAVEIPQGDDYCIKPNSNTTIIFNGNLLLHPNDLSAYSIVKILHKHNVILSGGGSIIGDIINHIGTEGEWGMGISIVSSRNVILQNITIKNCWGDCIYIGQSIVDKEDYSENVKIDNVTCQAGRRQGLSLIAGKNIHIKGSRFIDTGKIKYTAPGRGIDVEPNDKEKSVVHNIMIEDCEFSGNYNNNDFLTYNLNQDATIKVLRCKMDGNVSLYQNSYNVVIDSCEMNALDYVSTCISDNYIKNTTFKSVKPNLSSPQKVRIENCEYPKEIPDQLGRDDSLGNFIISFFHTLKQAGLNLLKVL